MNNMQHNIHTFNKKHLRKNIALYTLILLVILASTQLSPYCRDTRTEMHAGPLPVDSFHTNRGDIRFMFYNVENLFDTINEPGTRDGDFTPSGSYKWTGYRYQKKLINLSKVIMAAGGYSPPDIIGLCEVENKSVLEGLAHGTRLSKFPYKIIHEESPDFRGIDVALLYLTEDLDVIDYHAIPVHFDENQKYTTRDILYAKFLAKKTDTLHVFINHWPSRRGGQQASEYRRISAAQTLKKKIDSLWLKNKNAKIIITGDFNDEPHNNSISKTLNAGKCTKNTESTQLYNLFYDIKNTNQPGSYKYKGQWNILDQFIVSGALVNSKQGLSTACGYGNIFCTGFLLKEDERYMGYKVNRTYLGPRYKGGFSDHLPVLLDMFWE